MSGTVRLGLVGCGRLAETGYVPASARARGVALVAVADPDPVRRGAVAAAASKGRAVEAFHDAAELLGGADVDAVVLATPARAHVTDAALAVERGVPVLVEKPPAPDAAGAARLLDLGGLVHVGFNRRFDPGAQAAREAVPAHGPVDLSLEIRYRRASWAAHVVRDEVLLDLVPHLVDWARWLTDSEVTSVAATRLHADRVALELALRRGRATVVAAADGLHRERIDVRDGSGDVVVRHRVGGRAAAVLGRLRPRAGPHPLEASLTAQLEAFARTVRRGRGDPSEGVPPDQRPDGRLATAADGHAVMSVIDAARASASGGGRTVPVTVPVTGTSERLPC